MQACNPKKGKMFRKGEGHKRNPRENEFQRERMAREKGWRQRNQRSNLRLRREERISGAEMTERQTKEEKGDKSDEI